jgi:hypothetical protein
VHHGSTGDSAACRIRWVAYTTRKRPALRANA